MVVKAFDYDYHGAPQSWGKVVAMRHALSKYPDCKFIWYLDQNAFIVNPTKSLESLVLETKTLERLMIKDYPVVPPDSIIKTFSHLRGQDADLILSQDKESLVHSSVILRNGEWSKFFLETWYDPLYRSYNFQKAERHALARRFHGSVGPSPRLANRDTGTRCAMAPHDIVQARPGPAKNLCRLLQGRARRRLPERRLCRHVARLQADGASELRSGVEAVFVELEKRSGLALSAVGGKQALGVCRSIHRCRALTWFFFSLCGVARAGGAFRKQGEAETPMHVYP